MSGAQKFSLSLLISVVVFSGFAVLAWSGLFDYIETTFYLDRVQSSVQLRVNRIADEVGGFHRSNLSRFSAVLNQPSVQRAFATTQSREDIVERASYFQTLETQLPSLDYVRFVGLGGNRIHFSTRESDYAETGESRIYTPVATLDETESVPLATLAYEDVAEENRSGLVGTGLPAPDITLAPVENQFIYRLPVLDEFGVLQGAGLFYFSGVGLNTRLVREGLVGAGDQIDIIPAPGATASSSVRGGVLVNGRTGWSDSLTSAIGEVWQSISAGERPVLSIDDETAFILFSSAVEFDSDNAGLVLYLFPRSDLQMTDVMKIVMLGAIFLTVFLLLFLVFNLRQTVVVLADRVKRFQINLLREFVENKQDLDFQRWRSELEDRREEVATQIRRGLGRIKPSQKEEVDQLIDSSWDEILEVLGSRATQAPERSVDLDRLEDIVERVIGNLQHAPSVRPAGQIEQPSARPAVPNGEPIEVEELSEADLAEEPEELGEPVEVEELTEADLAEETQDLGEPVEVEELTEGDFAEEAEELGEVEELGEPETLGEPVEVEELTEADFAEEPEELGEVEELGEPETLGEPVEVEELTEADPGEESEELGEPEALGEPVELEELTEADLAEEPAELGEVEALGEPVEVEELTEADLAEEPEELGEPVEVEELTEADLAEEPEELGEPVEVEELTEADLAEEPEELGESEPLGEPVEVEELTEADLAEEPEELGEPEPLGEPVEVADEAEGLDEAVELQWLAESEPLEIDASSLEALDVDASEVVPRLEGESISENSELDVALIEEVDSLAEPTVTQDGGVPELDIDLDDEEDVEGVLEGAHPAASPFMAGTFSFSRGIPSGVSGADERGNGDDETVGDLEDIGELAAADDLAADEVGELESADELDAEEIGELESADELDLEDVGELESADELDAEEIGELESADELDLEEVGELESADEIEPVAEPRRPKVKVAPLVASAAINFDEIGAPVTDEYEIAEIGELLKEFGVNQDVIVDRDGIVEIDDRAFAGSGSDDSPTRDLVESVVGEDSSDTASGVEELFGWEVDDLFAGLTPSELAVPAPAETALSSVVRFFPEGFDYDGFLKGYSQSEGGTIKSLVKFTRYWNARVGLILVPGDGELVPRHGLGIDQACLNALRIGHESGIFRNILSRNKVLLIKQPLRTVDYFYGLCPDEQLGYFQRALFLPAVFKGKSSYLLLGLPEDIEDMTDAFKSILPLLRSTAAVR